MCNGWGKEISWDLYSHHRNLIHVHCTHGCGYARLLYYWNVHVCGESWLAIKILNPPFPVLKAGHPVCILIFIFYCYSIFIWTYNLLFSVCVFVCGFSKPSRVPVYIYNRLYASLYSLYMYIYMYITAYCFFQEIMDSTQAYLQVHLYKVFWPSYLVEYLRDNGAPSQVE